MPKQKPVNDILERRFNRPPPLGLPSPATRKFSRRPCTKKLIHLHRSRNPTPVSCTDVPPEGGPTILPTWSSTATAPKPPGACRP